LFVFVAFVTFVRVWLVVPAVVLRCVLSHVHVPCVWLRCSRSFTVLILRSVWFGPSRFTFVHVALWFVGSYSHLSLRSVCSFLFTFVWFSSVWFASFTRVYAFGLPFSVPWTSSGFAFSRFLRVSSFDFRFYVTLFVFSSVGYRFALCPFGFLRSFTFVHFVFVCSLRLLVSFPLRCVFVRSVVPVAVRYAFSSRFLRSLYIYSSVIITFACVTFARSRLRFVHGFRSYAFPFVRSRSRCCCAFAFTFGCRIQFGLVTRFSVSTFGWSFVTVLLRYVTLPFTLLLRSRYRGYVCLIWFCRCGLCRCLRS
jgi:hypothetical protein